MSKKALSAFALLCMTPALIGCSSIAKGVTEAMMERKKEDTRLCDITGPGFDGINDSLDRPQGVDGSNHTKVLMVHGIGKHLPDYSAHFREKLVRALKLDSMDPVIKDIELVNQEKDGKFAGYLKIFKYYNADGKDLLFYELTWSPIGDEDKKVIEIDDSEAYSYKRSALNKSLKTFMNATVPDLMVYEGEKKPIINKAVSQSLCWMFDRQWDDLPVKGKQFCYASSGNLAHNLARDDYFVVTHSLGSRIATDAFNTFALLHEECQGEKQYGKQCQSLRTLDSTLKQESITVFMLANQLPLLQVGHPKPDIVGQIGSYCTPAGKHYGERLIEKTRIVAFSDPNDILSYPLPADYADNYIDSRTCPEVVNVNINVAQPSDLFGLTEFANPLEAHVGYQGDDRVIRIITQGLHRHAPDPLISKRCTWMNVEKQESKP